MQVGFASPRAHGHAHSNIVEARSKHNDQSAPAPTRHIRLVARVKKMTLAIKRSMTVSVEFLRSFFDPSACATHSRVFSSQVSLAACVSCTMRRLSWFEVPAKTWSPAFFCFGRSSPVRKASRTLLVPRTTSHLQGPRSAERQ